MKIADGFNYMLDCSGVQRDRGKTGTVVHCGGDMSSSGFDGGTDGFGDSSSSDAGDGGGCGGGCGGGD